MAWRRLGAVALQVVQASKAAAAQRDAAEMARERGPADGPALFTRVAVISGPTDHSPSAAAAA